jgi:hypothetical protein
LVFSSTFILSIRFWGVQCFSQVLLIAVSVVSLWPAFVISHSGGLTAPILIHLAYAWHEYTLTMHHTINYHQWFWSRNRFSSSTYTVKPPSIATWKYENRNSLLYHLSIYHHHHYTAQTAALLWGFKVYIFTLTLMMWPLSVQASLSVLAKVLYVHYLVYATYILYLVLNL